MRVLVAGARGKMGREVCKAVRNSDKFILVGGISSSGGTLKDVEIYTDLAKALKETNADAVVDFTIPGSIENNMEICLAHNIPMVIGTTGLSQAKLKEWQVRALQENWQAIYAPNFAIGAVLMMKFAQEAVIHFEQAEIIEYHHAQKLDAPSGTALRTKTMMEEVSGKAIPTHSVRLPGMVAHQEVILGLPGQTLTIRHDSNNRESFMPGVLLALDKVSTIKGLVIGLEHILFTDI